MESLMEVSFKDRLMEMEKYYYIHHPFNKALVSGGLNQAQVQGWVINRFYYQINVPVKDAAIIANCPDREVRRRWLKRIVDQDGAAEKERSIEAWLRLGEACGVERSLMLSQQHVLPGVRFAVDAYVSFAQKAPWQEAVAATLTGLFSSQMHQERLTKLSQHYPWIDSSGLQYFRDRLVEIPTDVEYALALTNKYFHTPAQQEKVLRILRFKSNILWSALDAVYLAYVDGLSPLGFERENL